MSLIHAGPLSGINTFDYLYRVRDKSHSVSENSALRSGLTPSVIDCELERVHINPLFQNGPGLAGEFTIDDLMIFPNSPKLERAASMWSAITKYALMVDRTHSEAINGVREFLSRRGSRPPSNEDELDDLLMAETELQVLSDSNSYLVKSLLFLLLVAYNEFAHKQVYQLVRPQGPALPPKGAYGFITKALTEDGVIRQAPSSFEQNFRRHIQPVRHNFAHGDWRELERTLAAVDIAQSFLAVAEYFHAVENNLRDLGHEM